MINIIIPYDEKQENLVRCLNSIKRQRVADVQMIVCVDSVTPELIEKYELQVVPVKEGEKYKALNEALQRASGEYVFFLNPTAIVNSITLERLLAEEQDGQMTCTTICHANDSQYPAYAELGNTVQGRLFHLKTIQENQITFDEAYAYSEALFLAKYFVSEKVNAFFVSEGTYVYEENEAWNHIAENRDFKCKWEEHLNTLAMLESPLRELYLEEYLPKAMDTESVDFEILSACEANFHSAYALIEEVAKIGLVKQWKKATDEKDDSAFEDVRDFISKYEDETPFFLHLLHLCELDGTKYGYIKENNRSNALFLIEANPCKEERCLEDENSGPILMALKEVQKENDSLKAAMELVNQRLTESTSRLESLINMQRETVKVSVPVEYVGPELAEQTIKNYAEGKLGLKTIFKSFGAWLKNKFRK